MFQGEAWRSPKKKKIRIFWKPARVCINGGIQEGRSDPWPSGWAVCCGDPTGDSALGREQNAPLSESGGAPRGSQGCYFGGVVVRWVVGGGRRRGIGVNISSRPLIKPTAAAVCRVKSTLGDVWCFFSFSTWGWRTATVLSVFHARRPHPNTPLRGNSAFQCGCLRAQRFSRV